ncbi:YhjD/YihY/BrkB family envelope integrity protein [Pseudonocardia acidicola]|uniref:YihY/virulence factor BrkB family protein n=1 Tax=Pseudonocardia acidicola TaxID=2724939 RepID=A0ABX1S7V4_9PSEU|nr:YhjD/YihY/BrkB family envelope integrity protein [Pseudonocardia acidicola]NMH96989.1 YihY/virulence factor BrkB family protein [Pseudonocardia acidicola]
MRVGVRITQTRKRIDESRVGHVQRRFTELDLVNQATILAALAFMLLIPVLVTVAALLPLGTADGVPAAAGRRFGLTDAATADLRQLFPTRATVRGASTAFGTALTLLSAYAWPTALQKAYEIAWNVPAKGWKALWRPLVWLVVFVAIGALLLEVGPLINVPEPGRSALQLLIWAPLLFVWTWWTQHFLLAGRVGWRLLLPGAVAMTIGLLALRLGATLFLSSTITYHYREYGPLGIVFMLLSWFIAFSVVMLGGAVVGVALREHRLRRAAAERAAPIDSTGEVSQPP